MTVDAGGNVVQRDDYYPFGLTFNHYESTPPANQYLNQGKELQPEISAYDFEWRMYSPAIGRTWQLDPHSERYNDHSPYS